LDQSLLGDFLDDGPLRHNGHAGINLHGTLLSSGQALRGNAAQEQVVGVPERFR
jgi:hypothetical protein